jgi:translation elongation factor EF-G
VLEALVQRLPPPKGDADAPLKALLVDSWYDPYLGVVILVRVKDGRLRKGQRIRMMANGQPHLVEQVGVFSPKMVPVESLGPGEMGYLTRPSRRSPTPTSATPSPTTAAPPDRRCRASSLPSRWSGAASTPSTPTTSTSCATRWASCG